MSLLDPASDPVVHPEDRTEPDESGPWLALLVAAAAAWVPLALLDWRLLVEGTLVWATVRSVSTLLLAPLAAAALLQDTRALGVAGVEVGRAKWAYALATLLVPPVAAVYLGHRSVLVDRTEGTSTGESGPDSDPDSEFDPDFDSDPDPEPADAAPGDRDREDPPGDEPGH